MEYLLAVETALVGLDRDELLAADGEAIGEGVVAGGEGRGEGVDVLLGELDACVSGIQLRDHTTFGGELRYRTVKPGDCASRPEKSAAKIPALSNWPEPIRLQQRCVSMRWRLYSDHLPEMKMVTDDKERCSRGWMYLEST